MTKPPVTANVGAEIALRPLDGPIRPIEAERPVRFASVIGLSTALHVTSMLGVLMALGPQQLPSAAQELDVIAVELVAMQDPGAEQDRTSPGVPESSTATVRPENLDPAIAEPPQQLPSQTFEDQPEAPSPEASLSGAPSPERSPAEAGRPAEGKASPKSTKPDSPSKVAATVVAKTSRKVKSQAQPDATRRRDMPKGRTGTQATAPKGAQGSGTSGERPDRIGGPRSGAVSAYPGKVQARVQSAAGRSGVGEAGKVLVSLTVAADGRASDVRLFRTSGNPVLDRIALAAVRRASPFPPIPREAGRTQWAFTVPVQFGSR